MPTYEYVCSKCDNKFEVFQTMQDKCVKKCPKCNGKVDRLLGSGSGIIFKGSGFYETDYKKKSGTKSPSCEKPKSDGCKSCPMSKGKGKKD
jgi:putative FmdB family regulatory protein